ncbi:MAG TPA: hypothetical protein VGJ31_01950 [Dongiaceae bacterium]
MPDTVAVWDPLTLSPVSPPAKGPCRFLALLAAREGRVPKMVPEVELRYIPRSFAVEPRIRVTVFRSEGSAILDVQNSVITEFCKPDSESREDTLRAFRESIPFLLRALNSVIAATPSGGVVFVTANMIRASEKVA